MTSLSTRKASLILLTLWLLHRLSIFLLFRTDLEELIASNPEWLTWQYLKVEALRDHLFKSLWYLQQTPPLPNLIQGLAIKLFGWPYGADVFTIWFSSILNLIASVLMYLLMTRMRVSSWISLAVSAVYVLSVDTLVLEYNSFGQTFYEILPSVFLLLLVLVFIEFNARPSPHAALLMGLLTAILPMTRASYSYYALVPAVMIMLSSRAAPRVALAFLLPLTALQGGWALKNWQVYGYFDLSTSSWKGGNFVSGLRNSGMERELKEHILATKDTYSPWFVSMIEREGIVTWHPPRFVDYAPPEIQHFQERIDGELHGTNRTENYIAQRAAFEEYFKAYRSLVVAKPGLIWTKFWRSYSLFWQPIRNYSHQFVSIISVEPVIEQPFNLLRTAEYYLQRKLPEQQLTMKGNFFSRTLGPTKFFALHTLPHLFVVLVMILTHLGLPALGLFLIIKRPSGGLRNVLPHLLIVTTAIYAFVVFNLPDYLENMRFRLSIEPLLWALTASVLSYLWRAMLRNGVLHRLSACDRSSVDSQCSS